jgi:tRNA-dihydrouridine synthase B
VQIGPHRLENNLILAPMAGVTDRPFRQLCRRLGAGLAVSEMVSANSALWGHRKTQRRLDHLGESGPIVVQILGAEPAAMAEAARRNVDLGADVIDINMGCPAKKVCRVAAGSALLRDEALVGRVLETVVRAVGVPVTLKMRTGWSPQQRNAVRIARIAEQCGIAALAIHGRTRACGYAGRAEYDSARAVKAAVGIPVIANGDIDSPGQAEFVLDYTNADAIMIGRAARGHPWIFEEIKHYLTTGDRLPPPSPTWIFVTVLEHLRSLHEFYGPLLGVRVARKHIAWYSKGWPGGARFRREINNTNSTEEQIDQLERFFERQARVGGMAA